MIDALKTTAMIYSAALLTAGIVAVLLFLLWLLSRSVAAWRAKRREWARLWDSTEDDIDGMRAALRERGRVLLAPLVAEHTGPSWEQRAAAYARYVDEFAALVQRRAEILRQPTAEYRLYVAEEFGVALDEVGPAESTVRRSVLVDGRWVPQDWAQDELPMAIGAGITEAVAS